MDKLSLYRRTRATLNTRLKFAPSIKRSGAKIGATVALTVIVSVLGFGIGKAPSASEDNEPPSTQASESIASYLDMGSGLVDPPEDQFAELSQQQHQEANDRDMVAERDREEARQTPEPVALDYYMKLANKYSRKYNADLNWLTRVRSCESGNNHLNDRNPVCKGLFQFMPSTFYANAKRAGLENPDIWSADDQTNVAAYMQSIGQQGQWTCK